MYYLTEELKQQIIQCIYNATHGVPFGTVNELIKTLDEIQKVKEESDT